MTPDELKAIHRDARRRRIKYKSKCVHTNRKSTTEVLRDVIESQMEQYEDYLRDEQDTGSIAGLTECSDRSISKERRDDREVSKERRADYDDRSYSKEKRDNDREKRDDYSDKSYNKREDYDYSKRNDDHKRDSYNDQHYSKDKKGEYDNRKFSKGENYNDKSYSKKDDYDRNYSKDRKDTDSSSYSKDEYNGRAHTTYVEPNVNIKDNADNNIIKEQHTIKVHTKGYLKEYSTELRNTYSQEQSKDTVNTKKHQLLIEAEIEHESNETASPRSSRSQNSYRSQESRHRGRPRTPTEPEGRSHRERSRSRDRRYSTSRYENEYRHDRSRRYDRDHERKYRDRRHRYDLHRSDR